MRTASVFGIILLFIAAFSLTPNTASAADALYRMLHADEVESFKADQDAFIVGQLVENRNGRFLVNVITVLSGTVKSNEIWVESFEYGWGAVETTPQVNDYCVMSLKKRSLHYKIAWGTYRADSGDYRTLRLMTDDTEFSACQTDIAAIQWYVNSGGTENDFSFSVSTVSVHRPNGDTLQIYPKQTDEALLAAPPEALPDLAPVPHASRFDTSWLLVGLVAVGAAVLARMRMNNKE